MDPELTHAITGFITLLLGGGGVYGVQRMRGGSNGTNGTNGTAPGGPESASRDDVMDSIHNLTTEVKVGFETVNTKIVTVARAERDAHEDKWHAVNQ